MNSLIAYLQADFDLVYNLESITSNINRNV